MAQASVTVGNDERNAAIARYGERCSPILETLLTNMRNLDSGAGTPEVMRDAICRTFNMVTGLTSGPNKDPAFTIAWKAAVDRIRGTNDFTLFERAKTEVWYPSLPPAATTPAPTFDINRLLGIPAKTTGYTPPAQGSQEELDAAIAQYGPSCNQILTEIISNTTAYDLAKERNDAEAMRLNAERIIDAFDSIAPLVSSDSERYIRAFALAWHDAVEKLSTSTSGTVNIPRLDFPLAVTVTSARQLFDHAKNDIWYPSVRPGSIAQSRAPTLTVPSQPSALEREADVIFTNILLLMGQIQKAERQDRTKDANSLAKQLYGVFANDLLPRVTPGNPQYKHDFAQAWNNMKNGKAPEQIAMFESAKENIWRPKANGREPNLAVISAQDYIVQPGPMTVGHKPGRGDYGGILGPIDTSTTYSQEQIRQAVQALAGALTDQNLSAAANGDGTAVILIAGALHDAERILGARGWDALLRRGYLTQDLTARTFLAMNLPAVQTAIADLEPNCSFLSEFMTGVFSRESAQVLLKGLTPVGSYRIWAETKAKGEFWNWELAYFVGDCLLTVSIVGGTGTRSIRAAAGAARATEEAAGIARPTTAAVRALKQGGRAFLEAGDVFNGSARVVRTGATAAQQALRLAGQGIWWGAVYWGFQKEFDNYIKIVLSTDPRITSDQRTEAISRLKGCIGFWEMGVLGVGAYFNVAKTWGKSIMQNRTFVDVINREFGALARSASAGGLQRQAVAAAVERLEQAGIRWPEGTNRGQMIDDLWNLFKANDANYREFENLLRKSNGRIDDALMRQAEARFRETNRNLLVGGATAATLYGIYNIFNIYHDSYEQGGQLSEDMIAGASGGGSANVLGLKPPSQDESP